MRIHDIADGCHVLENLRESFADILSGGDPVSYGSTSNSRADGIWRLEGDTVIHAMSLDQNRIAIDPVRWAVQALLLALVSPALIAVLVVGGLMICGSKIYAATSSASSMLVPARSH